MNAASMRLVAAPDALRAELAKPPPVLVRTGIVPLDGALNGGLGSSGVTYLAAGTGRGKTGLVIQVARTWLADGRAVLFLETELPLRQVLLRFVAQETGESWSSLNACEPAKAAELVAVAVQQFPRLYVHEWRRDDDLASLVAALPEPANRRGVIVDQISDLARARATDRADMRTATMQVSSELKQLAMLRGVPVVAVTPTSRGVTSNWNERRDKRKGREFESAAKDAGELEYDAETLLYLDTEPSQGGVAAAALHIAKARHAESNKVIPLQFRAAVGLFLPVGCGVEKGDDAKVLALVRERGPLGISKITNELHIGQIKVVACVDRLVAAGKVRKDPVRGITALPDSEPA